MKLCPSFGVKFRAYTHRRGVAGRPSIESMAAPLGAKWLSWHLPHVKKLGRLD